MKYFQTDDRDDYFASLDSKNKPPKHYVLRKDGVVLIVCKELWRLKVFLKTQSPNPIDFHMKSVYDICDKMGMKLSKERKPRREGKDES
jgi:hypothetical protein